jgi:hypothetical protein
MKKSLLILSLFCAYSLNAQNQNPENAKMKPEMTEFWDPEVTVVTPGNTPQDAPSDAIVLFDGTGTSLMQNWTNGKGEAPGWKIADNCVTVVKGAGDIKTKMDFEDVQLHVEWRTPAEVVGTSQGRGNSGVYLQSLYELQVLDDYDNRTYRNGQAGSFYKQYAPLVNVCKKPGEWQTYDVVFIAPRFKENGTLLSPAKATVFQNGVLVQCNVELFGPTEYIGIPKYKKHGAAPLLLQNHNNPVSYRNVWIRKLNTLIN